MKKILAFVIAFVAIVSCTVDPISPEQPVVGDGTVTVNLGVDVPVLGDGGTRAFSDEPGTGIKNLYVAVFDDSGYLAEYKKCTCEDGYPIVSTNDSLSLTDTRKYSVTLNVSKTVPRIMHFIANGPDHVAFGSEEEVIASMTAHLNPTAGQVGPDCYWQRIVLTHGITYELGTTALNAQSASELQHVGLIRNFAEFTIESSASEFELTCAKILMCPDLGYVAPYNKTTGNFVMNYANKTVTSLLAEGYIGSAPATARVAADFENPTAAVGGKVSQFMFEREKPTSAPACVIVGGHYNGSTDVQYYKVNLVDEDGEYYPIMRNFKYHVSISAVAARGKATIEEAYRTGGTGDISTTFEFEELTNVSNGSSKLIVQYVEKMVVTDDEFELRYKFVPDISSPSTTANNIAAAGSLGVQANLQPESELVLGKAIDHITVASTDNSDGSRTIRVKPVAPSAFQKTQKIILIGTAIVDGRPKTIQRHVTIVVREKMTLTAYCQPSTVAATVGSKVDLHITLPKGLRQSMFPLILNIEAKENTMSPMITENLPVESGKSLFNTSKPGYHFVKTVNWEDYYIGTDDVIDDSDYVTNVVCKFKTNKAASASLVRVSNDFFNDATTFFDNPGSTSLGNKFTSLAFSEIASDGSVDFTFSMPNTDPVVVTLSNLVPAVDEDGLAGTGVAGVYTYTPSSSGTQTFSLKTASGGDGTYTVSLQSSMYEPAAKTIATRNAIFLPDSWHVDAATVSGSMTAPAVGYQSTLTAYVYFKNTTGRNVKFYVGTTELTPTTSTTTTFNGLECDVYTCNYTPTAQGYYTFKVEAWNSSDATDKTVLQRTGSQGLGVWDISLGSALTSASFDTDAYYVLKNSRYNTYLYWNGSGFAVETNSSNASVASNSKYSFKFSKTSGSTGPRITNILGDKDLRFDCDNNLLTYANAGSGSTIEVYDYSSSYQGFKMRDNNDSSSYYYRFLYQNNATSVALSRSTSGTYSNQDGYWQIIPVNFVAPE